MTGALRQCRRPGAGPRRDGSVPGLGSAQDGVAIIEFALVAPIFLLMVIGMLDLGQMLYGQVLLNGAAHAAGRNSALEGVNTAAEDAKIATTLAPVLPGARIAVTRSRYDDFTDIGRPEKWNDTNNDGACDTGESYIDENGNGRWDQDVGTSGNGGADDVVLATVTARYEPVFRIPFMPDKWAQRTLTATSVNRNQPYAVQQRYGSATGTCS